MLKIKVTSGNVSVEVEIPMTERKILGTEEGLTGHAILHVTQQLFEQIKEHNSL